MRTEKEIRERILTLYKEYAASGRGGYDDEPDYYLKNQADILEWVLEESEEE